MTKNKCDKYFEVYEWVIVDEKLLELVERDTPMLPIKLKWKNNKDYYFVCPKCLEMVARDDEVFCQDCGQRLDWRK